MVMAGEQSRPLEHPRSLPVSEYCFGREAATCSAWKAGIRYFFAALGIWETMQMSRKLRTLAVLFICSPAATTIASPALGEGQHSGFAGERRVVTYSGEMLGHPGSTLEIERHKRSGEDVRVEFGFNDVVLQCDDGSIKDLDYLKRAGFRGENTFQAKGVGLNLETGNKAPFELKGRFLDGLVRGYFEYEFIVADPPAEGYENDPDCSTQGKVRWRAERVG